MTEAAKKILKEAMNLPADERASLIEELMSSLEKPDIEIDASWLKEAEERLEAYERGEVKAYPADEVFSELGKS